MCLHRKLLYFSDITNQRQEKWLSLLKYYHIVRLTIWHHLLLEFSLVSTWFSPNRRHQRAVTRLEIVRQLNIRKDEKLGFQWSQRQPLWYLPYQIELISYTYRPKFTSFSKGVFSRIYTPFFVKFCKIS